jgi:hypothetical protein
LLKNRRKHGQHARKNISVTDTNVAIKTTHVGCFVQLIYNLFRHRIRRNS